MFHSPRRERIHENVAGARPRSAAHPLYGLGFTGSRRADFRMNPPRTKTDRHPEGGAGPAGSSARVGRDFPVGGGSTGRCRYSGGGRPSPASLRSAPSPPNGRGLPGRRSSGGANTLSTLAQTVTPPSSGCHGTASRGDERGAHAGSLSRASSGGSPDPVGQVPPSTPAGRLRTGLLLCAGAALRGSRRRSARRRGAAVPRFRPERRPGHARDLRAPLPQRGGPSPPPLRPQSHPRLTHLPRPQTLARLRERLPSAARRVRAPGAG